MIAKTEVIANCHLCQSAKLRYLYSTRDRMFNLPGRFAIKRCEDCQLWILSPRPPANQLPQYYPRQNYYSYQIASQVFFSKLREYLAYHYYQPSLLSKIISTIIHQVPALPQKFPPGKIMDIGCGAGDTLLLLKKIGWKVSGLEIDKQAVVLANKRGLTNVKYGGYRDLKKYPDNYFDVIRLYHVIEHLDDPFLCLKLITAKVKKNGEVIIGTPNSNSFAAKLFGSYWYNLDSPRHLFLFRPNLLKKISFQSGLKPLRVEFCSAGGIIGSIQYFLGDKFRLNLDLIHQPLLVILFYPLEWLLDKLNTGDIFVLRATRAIV